MPRTIVRVAVVLATSKEARVCQPSDTSDPVLGGTFGR